jgi:hypothetical protein
MRDNPQSISRIGISENDKPFCPATYRVWARGLEGYAVAVEFEASKL